LPAARGPEIQPTWSDANLVHTASSARAVHERRARGNRKAGAIVGFSRASVRLKSAAAVTSSAGARIHGSDCCTARADARFGDLVWTQLGWLVQQ
jgi:hypothetical protein